MPLTIEELLEYVKVIDTSLKTAQQHALKLRHVVQQQEGDSDLYRKIEFYTVPNLTHWIEGLQAGNVKDLFDTLNGRLPKVETKKEKKKKK